MTFLCSCKTQFAACVNLTKSNSLASGRCEHSSVNSQFHFQRVIAATSPHYHRKRTTRRWHRPLRRTINLLMLPWWKLQLFPSKTVASSFRLVLPLFTSNMVICQYSVNHLPDLQMLYEKGKKTELVFHPNSLNITWRSTDKSGRSRGSIGFWYTVKLNWPYLILLQ